MATAITKAQRFCNLSVGYLRRNNPILLFLNTIITNWTEIVTSTKKKKIAQYRVNHLKYRLYQMEQLIEQSNPYNIAGGKKFDKLQ